MNEKRCAMTSAIPAMLALVLAASCGTTSPPPLEVDATQPSARAPLDAASHKGVRRSGDRDDMVPVRSLAGVKVGASQRDIEAAFGAPEEVSDFEDRGRQRRYFNYQSKGVSFSLLDGRLQTIFAYTGRIGGYETGDYARYAGAVPPGVTLDSTYTDVVRAYGPPDEAGELANAPVPSRWISYKDGVGFDFIIESGEMISLNVHDTVDRD